MFDFASKKSRHKLHELKWFKNWAICGFFGYKQIQGGWIMEKFICSLFLAFFLIPLNVSAQTATTAGLPRFEFPLWAGDAPGALGKEAKDMPTLTPYFAPPGKATGASFVICPGGGYAALAPHEGYQYALWLNEQGISAFVLKYRLGSGGYRHPAMMQDIQRAIRYVRANAEKWGLDPNRIGVMGSSAGGHLAATDRKSVV